MVNRNISLARESMNRTVSKKSTIMKKPPISTHYLLLQKKRAGY